eukprot:COSAG02_NODE_13845_length_1339_cov_2.000806_1_plen_38_part_10
MLFSPLSTHDELLIENNLQRQQSSTSTPFSDALSEFSS